MKRFACSALAAAALACALPAAAIDVPCWPFVYHKEDAVSGETETSLGGVVYVRHKTAAYTANQILSVPQQYPPGYPYQFYLLWPMSGLRCGNGHDAWLFPVLWSGNSGDGRERRFSLFPAFYYGRKNDDHTLNLCVLQHNSWDANSSAHYLFPLFWYSADREGPRLSLGLLPLAWFSRNSSTNSGNGGQSTYSSSYGGVLLVNWWGRYRFRSVEKSGRTDTIVSEHDGLAPVFSRRNRVHTSIQGPSVEADEDSHLWIVPYFRSRDVSVRSNAVTGVATSFRSESLLGVAPVYWAWDDTRDRRQNSGKTLLPFWWRSEEYVNGVVEASSSFIVPIGAHFFRKGQYDTVNVAGPVFTRLRNDRLGYTRYDLFFPLVSRTKGLNVSGGRIFPFFGWDIMAGRHENAWYMFPFGWRMESAGEPYQPPVQRALGLNELGYSPWTNRPRTEPPKRTAAVLPFWLSRREPEEEDFAILPLFWRNTDRDRMTRVQTVLPLLLGSHETDYRDDTITSSRQDYLLSILAHGSGDDFNLWRAFPFFSYQRRGDSMDVSSLILPFSYSASGNPTNTAARRSSELTIPFEFLPLYNSRTTLTGPDDENSRSWLFPFYNRSTERTATRNVRRLSILWPIWNAEWENDETHIRGLGGISNFYERDSNGFVEQRLLYRFFTRRNRSWFSEHELMPFYSRTAREDGTGSWDFLGGLLGAGRDASRRYVRLLYIPITTGRGSPAADDDATRAVQDRHAGYALNYLKHNRYDRAAIEFTLAGEARANDLEFQLATAEAYLNAEPAVIARELRSSIPPDLKFLSFDGHSREEARVRRGLREAAVSRFETAIRLGADKPDTLVRIARAQCDLSETAKALATLEASDALRPSFSTAMERVGVLSLVAQPLRQDANRQRRVALLESLLKRYPESPTLLLQLALLPAPGQDSPARYGWSGGWYGGTDVFAAHADAQLDLLRRAAAAVPGEAERTWLAAGAKPMYSDGTAPETSPRSAAARIAVSLLNTRVNHRLADKKTADAAALLPDIRPLLPRACLSCEAKPGDRHWLYAGSDDSAGNTAANLYWLYVRERKEPLKFIATVKDWAAGLCEHQRKTFEEALESVRFEQQYLKSWRIAGDIGGKKINLAYRGEFFQRYVDLDALLGKPDQCEVEAECVIVSPDDRPAVLRLGFDRTLTAELNGATVFGPESAKIAVRDEHTIPLTLTKGENRLRLTVADDKLGYGFFARLSAPTGELMEDVSVAPAPE